MPTKFASGEYQVLIVAEKYQTGFDQPLLHTMYVDKRLAGLQAVQTLSRLNRIHPGKEEPFVLDFVNDPQEILEAFKPYYEATMVGEQAQPSQLYDLQARLDGYQVYYHAEVEEFARVFYQPAARQRSTDHARMNACLDPAVARFRELEPGKQEEFRKTLTAFRNLYAFLAQIIPFQDTDLEKLYAFVRFLLLKLPRRGPGATYQLDGEVALQYYRLQKVSEDERLVLEGGETIDGPTEVGTRVAPEGKIRLSQLIDLLNERFATDFKAGDQLTFDAVRADVMGDEELKQAAQVNTKDNYGYVVRGKLIDKFIERWEQNEGITARMLNDADFREVVTAWFIETTYQQFRAPPLSY